jgi:hypothetical protein
MVPPRPFLKLGFSGNFLVNCFSIVLQISIIDLVYEKIK